MAKTLEQRVYDGERARQVLENEAFAQAFADMREEYTKAWMESPARDAEGREKLYLMVKLTDKLQAVLTSAMEDGKLANLELEREKSRLQRAREWISGQS